MDLMLPTPFGRCLEPMEIAPNVMIQAYPAEELPLGRPVVDDGSGSTLEEMFTRSGWPVSLVRTRDPEVLHAYFMLFDCCVHVVAVGSAPGSLDAAMERLRSCFIEADIDRTPHKVVALAQLWEEPV